MKLTKRLLSLILCLAMVLPMIPAEVFAASEPLTLTDGYITVNVADNGGFRVATAEGDILRKSDNNKNLLYHNGKYDTSFVSFRVGTGSEAKEYLFGGKYRNSTDMQVSQQGDTIVATWGVDGITFTQTIALENEASLQHGMVSVTLAASGTTKQVQARVLLDTCLGSQDYTYYQVNDGTLDFTMESEQEIDDSSLITAFYAVDDVAAPSVTAYMIGQPYKVAIGHWNNLASSLFEFQPDTSMYFTNSINDYQTADSACALYYDLSEGAVTAYYGVYSNHTVDLSQSVAINAVSPLRLNLVEVPDDAHPGETKKVFERLSDVGVADFDIRVDFENFETDIAQDYSKVLLTVSTTSGLRPLNDSGQESSNWDFGSADPWYVSYNDFNIGESRTKTVYLKAKSSGGATYERITIGVYDDSTGEALDGGQPVRNFLLGEKVIYLLLPGDDGNVPRISFNSMTPKTIFNEGTRHLYLAVTNAAMLEDYLLSSACQFKAVNVVNGTTVPIDNVTVNVAENTVDVALDDSVKLALGAWQLRLDWTPNAVQQGFVEEAFKQQTSAELQFTVSNDAKYRNDAYGVLAVVKYGVRSSHDDPIRYELRAFKSEDDFKLFVQKRRRMTPPTSRTTKRSRWSSAASSSRTSGTSSTIRSPARWPARLTTPRSPPRASTRTPARRRSPTV